MTILAEYPHGTKVRLWGIFRSPPENPLLNVPGALVAPAVVTIKYITPNGTITTVSSPTTATTGIYYTDVTANIVGTWRYRATGDSIVQEGAFIVKPSPFSSG